VNESASTQEARYQRTDSFRIRLGLLMLFCIPLAYVGMILAVAVHEVLGHGLAAWLVGGTFAGFVLQWDSMGWAYVEAQDGAPASHEIVILSAGILVTTLVGSLLLALAIGLRERLFMRLAASIFSVCFLLEGLPYLFWSALCPTLPLGDPARIIELSASQTIRWTFVATGAVLTVAATFIPVAVPFRAAEGWLASGGPLSQRRRFVALLLLVVVPAATSEFLFDWNQLVPGIGLWPPVCGTGLFVAASGWLYYRPPSEVDVRLPLSTAIWPVVGSWSLAVGVVVAVILWLSDGVTWS
jgi:hypothetical protein